MGHLLPIRPDEEEDDAESWSLKKQALIQDAARNLFNGGLEQRIQAARDIRKLARSSVRTRSSFAAAGVIPPLISMLNSSEIDAKEASLLALLNLAVRNERNKVKIVKAGAVPPLIELLKLEDGGLRELATAAVLTLSASPANKPIITAAGAAPLLGRILNSGTVQGKVDAVTALYNLSTCTENQIPILDSGAVFPLISLLKECKKYSKFAEKTTALLESLSHTEEGIIAIASSEGGILALVETIEDGSLVSTEHAVGALLALCQSCREKYRELILQEGAIPGLLQLTVQGTAKAQHRARALLELLRDTREPKPLSSAEIETIVYDIAARVDGAEKAAETAKRLLQDMVKRSMELSMSSIEQRAFSCTPSDSSSSSEMPSS
ncbi:U-box domain-containing protein 3 [Nymphaea colorata]|nr:U-box domain-containing protein 3 [Nymphaea colorata]